MTRWVLADYGEVISDPMPAETILELADLAALAATVLGLQAVRCVTGCDRRRVRLAQWS